MCGDVSNLVGRPCLSTTGMDLNAFFIPLLRFFSSGVASAKASQRVSSVNPFFTELRSMLSSKKRCPFHRGDFLFRLGWSQACPEEHLHGESRPLEGSENHSEGA